MDRVDCVVVGAGVVGLAIARALARLGREVIVLEREGLIGGHTSSRNSEVIHAGIYYPRGSAKARMCVRGKALLYEYCASRGVPHRRLGKIIVATEDGQTAQLEGIKAAAAGNGVEDLRLLDRADLARLEPALRGVAGLMSPSTGILDSHAFMLSLRAEIEDAGGAIAFHARLAAARPVAAGFEIGVESGAGTPAVETLSMETGLLGQRRRALRGRGGGGDRGIGARAPAARALLQGQLFQRRGFRAGRRAPFRHLIYPVPERDGLGVHLTLDMAGAGAVRAGYRMGGGHRLWARSRAAAPAFTPRSAATGPGCPTARLRRAIPASGRSSIPKAGRRRTLSSTGRRPMGWRVWSISSASRAPA